MGKMSGEMKEMEEGIKGGDKKDGYKERVNKFKVFVETYINRCEQLESYETAIKNIKLSELISIQKENFKLKSTALRFLKNLRKRKGMAMLTWSPQQKKQDFTLAEEGSRMILNFSSCYNDHHGGEWFTTGEAEIELEVYPVSLSSTSYFSIGLTNESFLNETLDLGCQSASIRSCFVLKGDGNAHIATVSSYTGIMMPVGVATVIIMKANFNDKTLTFGKRDGQTSNQFRIEGNKWRISTSNCTSGNVTYKFLESTVVD